MNSMDANPDEFVSVHYQVKDRVAHITLNRPERFNAIDLHMPLELEKCVEIANFDDNVKVLRDISWYLKFKCVDQIKNIGYTLSNSSGAATVWKECLLLWL